MMDNPHFATAHSWDEAAGMLTFRPRQPSYTAGLELDSLRVHVRDHTMRELAVAERTLESHYGGFVLSQSWKGAQEASRWALTVPFGPVAREAMIAGFAGRAYDLGPEPPPDDVDPRAPAVVTWSDGGLFYFIASGTLSADELTRIAVSLYDSVGGQSA